MPRVVIDPAVPDRASLDNEIARLRGLAVGELRARWHTSWIGSLRSVTGCFIVAR
jgi:hypothetical protein